MFNYLLLNVAVLALVTVFVLASRWPLSRVCNRQGLLLIAALFLITAIGDNVIIGLHLVDYDLAHILGVYLGRAPIEDFSYALLAALLVPLLWERGAKK